MASRNNSGMCSSCGLPVEIDLSGPKEIWLDLPKCQRTKPVPAKVPKDAGYYFVKYTHCKHLVSNPGCGGYSCFSWHIEPEQSSEWHLVYIDSSHIISIGTDETAEFSTAFAVVVGVEPLPKEAWPSPTSDRNIEENP